MKRILIAGAALLALTACGQKELEPLTNQDVYLGEKGDVITVVVPQISTTAGKPDRRCGQWLGDVWQRDGDCGSDTPPVTKRPPPECDDTNACLPPPTCRGAECHPVEPPCTKNCGEHPTKKAKNFPITASDRAEDASGKERNKDVGTNYETETPNRHDNSVKEDTDTEKNPRGDDDDATDGETSTPPNDNPRAAFNR